MAALPLKTKVRRTLDGAIAEYNDAISGFIASGGSLSPCMIVNVPIFDVIGLLTECKYDQQQREFLRIAYEAALRAHGAADSYRMLFNINPGSSDYRLHTISQIRLSWGIN